MTLTAVLDRLRSRAEDDPALVETLQHLADAGRVDDPFAMPDEDVRRVARQVNRGRQADRLAHLRARSLTTGQVVDLLASVSDRKGVDRRRARGSLLGVRMGNQTLHPQWQFDRRRRDTHPGLGRLLAALDTVAADPIDADAIATTPQPDADGRSIADMLAEGEVDAAVALARLAGDQS